MNEIMQQQNLRCIKPIQITNITASTIFFEYSALSLYASKINKLIFRK